MCGLCGVLGAQQHWTVADGARRERRLARGATVAAFNHMLSQERIVLKDFNNTAYQLRSSTGRVAIADTISEAWALADRLSPRSLDPLGDAMLAGPGGGP